MEDILISKRNDIIREKNYNSDPEVNFRRHDMNGKNPPANGLLAECGLNFFLYLKSLNFSNESDVIVLPSDHHFYYDSEELKSVRVLINIRKLNLIKKPEEFLNTLVRVLPAHTCFIGCFSDSKSSSRDMTRFNKYSILFNRFLNFLDSRTDNIMNKSGVSALLEKKGFKTLDMKEINGLTYFYCRTSIQNEETVYYKKIG